MDMAAFNQIKNSNKASSFQREITVATKKISLLASAIAALSFSYHTQAQQTWSYTYHPTNGQIATADGPRTDVNDVTTYGYDANGNVSDMSNAAGHVTLYPEYDASGRVLQMIDADNVVTNYTYTVRGWLESVTIRAPNGNPTEDAITLYTYDAVGQVIRVDLPGQPGFSINFEYDGARRLTDIHTANDDRITYTLDAAGNRLSETITGFSGVTYKTLTRAYDELSRIMQVTGANNQTTDVEYDVNDNVTTTINGRSFPTSQTHDALDRVDTVEDALQGTITYTYDAQDNVKSVTDQRGNITAYDYDGFGNLLQISSPDTGVTTFTYDEANNVKTQTDARGIVTEYSYDALNRLTQINYPDDSSQNIIYTYDEGSAVFGSGRLTEVRDSSGDTRYRYDHRGNVTETLVRYYSGPNVSPEIVTQYVYDIGDNRVETVYPSGRVLRKSYDGQHRVFAVDLYSTDSLPPQTLVSEIEYLPFGPAASWQLGNSLLQVNTYDQDYRLTDLTVSDPNASQTPATVALSYTYDEENNIEDITDLSGFDIEVADYSYDPLDRLIDFTSSNLTTHYEYDAVGNRLLLISTDANGTKQFDYNYEVSSNRLRDVLTDDGIRSFTYDANGNMIFDDRANDADLNLDFNVRNRLERVTSGGAQ